jgi:hypothetical protein
MLFPKAHAYDQRIPVCDMVRHEYDRAFDIQFIMCDIELMLNVAMRDRIAEAPQAKMPGITVFYRFFAIPSHINPSSAAPGHALFF